MKVAIKCKYYPKEISPSLPKYNEDANINEEEYLIKLANDGLNLRIKDYETDIKKDYKTRLDYELEIINKIRYIIMVRLLLIIFVRLRKIHK